MAIGGADARAILQLVLDSDQFSDEMKQTSREAMGDIEKMEGQFEKLEKAAEGTAVGMKAVRNAINSVVVAVVARAFAGFVKDTIGVKTSLDSLRNTLLAVSESQDEANDKFDFAAQTAQRLGLELITTVKSFTQFDAAAAATTLRGEAARKIFTSVSEAATVLGKSTAETAGVFQALEQILNKGTVQSEEITKQFGQRIPGGFALAARSIGKTTEEFKKMLEQGQLVAEDFLPKLAVELDNTFGGGLETAVKTLRAELERMNTTLTLFKGNFAEGFADTIVAEFGSIGESAEAASKKGRTLGEVFGLAISIVTNSTKIMANTVGAALTEVIVIFVKFEGVILEAARAFAVFLPGGEKLEQSLRRMQTTAEDFADALHDKVGQNLLAAGEGVEGLKDAFARFKEGVDEAGESVGKLGDSVEEFGEQTDASLKKASEELRDFGDAVSGIRDGVIADAEAMQAALAKAAAVPTPTAESLGQKKSIEELTAEIKALQSQTLLSVGEAERLQLATAELAKSQQTYREELEITDTEAQRSFKAQQDAAKKLDKVVTGAKDRVAELSEKYQELGVVDTRTAQLIISNFEEQTRQIGTTSDQVGAFLEELGTELDIIETKGETALIGLQKGTKAASDNFIELSKNLKKSEEDTKSIGEQAAALAPSFDEAAKKNVGLNEELETTVVLFKEIGALAQELRQTI